jgi:hypothetical protein
VEFLQIGVTFNSEQYVQTFKKLQQFNLKGLAKHKMNQVLLLHDNARPHTILFTKAVATIGWTVTPHPSCSPDLALSSFHPFGFPKDAV